MADSATIRIQGARQHNLKNLSLELPRNQLIVVTGVSGSGKSSLAFDTLYAEGQRRYVESLSAYARQFLERLEKPDVDFIDGLTPAIAIEQRTSQPNPRSTIATTTEIYDYLRILYAAIGMPHDPQTGALLRRYTVNDIVEELTHLPDRTKLVIVATVKDTGEDLRARLDPYRARGFLRACLDGRIVEIEEIGEKDSAEIVEIVVDRIIVRDGFRSRLADSLESAQQISERRVSTLIQEPESEDEERRDFPFLYTNPETGFTLPKLTPKHFSFNSHAGACPTCQGLGITLEPDSDLIVPDPGQSLNQGAVKTWWSSSKSRKGFHQRAIASLAQRYGADLDSPAHALPPAFKKALLYGDEHFEGLCVQAKRLIATSDSEITKRNVRRFMSPRPCITCDGRRLKDEILAVTLDHRELPLSIAQFTGLTISAAILWLNGVSLTRAQEVYATEVLAEVRKRLIFLERVGIGYLTLDRESSTLSGGESQRIRLATQLGAGLAGVLYVLDEPSIGLHQSDNEKLITTLRELRDAGNTVIVVEHDEETIRAADHLIDLGPEAGSRGGELLAQGSPDEVAKNPHSLTGAYLSGKRRIAVPPRTPLSSSTHELIVRGAREHNLRNITVRFPLGQFICVTGLSGSGKSTLVDDILRRALFRHFHRSKDHPGEHDTIEGFESLDKAIVIDQAPIGRSPRSNPATFVGVFNSIRNLFSQLPVSRTRGYGPGRFSFNVEGGRCEACQGDGSIRIDMHFLSDVYITCESCGGRRYNRETLDVAYRGKSIADVLAMTVEEALDFFSKVPKVRQPLQALADVGLDYVALGQSATTLSGGEAQRVKLAAELAKTATGRTVYLLDEPTTGLHFADIEVLLNVFYRLRDQGNTLIIVEHNLDVIKCADWIIDLGPGGGDAGGNLIAEGPPEALVKNSASLTGKYLSKVLSGR